MKTIFIRFFSPLVFTWFFIFDISPLFASDKTLVLGVYIFRNVAEMEQRFQPLAQYLSDNLAGYDVKLRVLTPKEMERAVDNNELDLIFTNPVHYVELSQKYKMTGAIATMVSLEQGHASDKLGGTIFSLKSSGFHGDLEELRGKRFAIYGRHSLGAYLAPMYEFKKVGIDVNRLGTLIDIPESHDNVVYAIMNGKADVGFVRTGVLESMDQKGEIDKNTIQILHPQHHNGFSMAVSTQLYPEWPLVAMPHVHSDVMRRISSLLLKIEPDDWVAKNANIYGFSVPASYKSVENMMRELHVFPFDKLEYVSLKRIWNTYTWQLSFGMIFLVMGFFFTLRLNRVNASLLASQNALVKEQAFVQGILDTEENIIMIFKKGAIHQFNHRFYEIIGYDNLQNFLNHHACICELFITKEGFIPRQKKEERWLESLKLSPDIIHKVALVDRRKEERFFSVQLGALSFDDVDYMIVTFNDITLIEEARRSAEESQRAKAAFLTTMSHEIRTPIHGILGFTSLLEQTELTPTQKRYLDIVNSSTNGLLKIVDNIIDFSNIESGTLSLESVPVNLKELIRENFEFHSPINTKKEIHYHLELAQNIPPCVIIDWKRLKQIIINILDNSFKFTTHGGAVDFHVEHIFQANDRVILRFRISDTGIGISDEQQKKILEPFGQADSSKTREYGGMGLGLSIATQLLLLFHSKLELQSALGEGSIFTFSIEIPRCDSNVGYNSNNLGNNLMSRVKREA